MIYTLTLNPAVDYIMEIGTLRLGATNRSHAEYTEPGGKGINVSAVLASLGVESTALGFIAGFTGDELERQVRERGIKTDFVRLDGGMTRVNVKLKGDAETEINGQGPLVGEDKIRELLRKLDRAERGDTLVMAGSVPGTLPCGFYADIMKRVGGRGVRLVVDTSGRALAESLPHHPYLIKPNRDELEEVSSIVIDSGDAAVKAARILQNKGAANVLVSLGGDGAILLCADGTVRRANAPRGKVVNSVGAGDAMLAGFLAGEMHGAEFALSLGIAAGSATAFKRGLAERDEILELL